MTIFTRTIPLFERLSRRIEQLRQEEFVVIIPAWSYYALLSLILLRLLRRPISTLIGLFLSVLTGLLRAIIQIAGLIISSSVERLIGRMRYAWHHKGETLSLAIFVFAIFILLAKLGTRSQKHHREADKAANNLDGMSLNPDQDAIPEVELATQG